MTLGVCFMLRRGNVNVLTIELDVITNFEEEQDSLGRLAKQLRRREAGQGQTKEGKMYGRLKCKGMSRRLFHTK